MGPIYLWSDAADMGRDLCAAAATGIYRGQGVCPRTAALCAARVTAGGLNAMRGELTAVLADFREAAAEWRRGIVGEDAATLALVADDLDKTFGSVGTCKDCGKLKHVEDKDGRRVCLRCSRPKLRAVRPAPDGWCEMPMCERPAYSRIRPSGRVMLCDVCDTADNELEDAIEGERASC